MNAIQNSLSKNFRSYGYALHGIMILIRSENNIKYQLLVAALTITIGYYLNIGYQDWLWVILMIGLVLMAEAFNTALEKLADYVQPDHHQLIGTAKDIAAGAVLIISLAASVVGVLVFSNYL